MGLTRPLSVGNAYVRRRKPTISGNTPSRASLMQSASPGRAESVDSSTCVASDSESLSAAIVITAPSSPDETPKQGQIPLPSPLLLGGEPAERTLSDLTDVPAILHTLPRATASTANSSTLPIPTFEQRLAAAEMPHPGPELFHARRTSDQRRSSIFF